jgi:hypothetical protein
MSHYAELDDDNKVIRVLVGNPKLSDDDGLAEIAQLLGGTWVQTSYNAKIRGNYAGIGFTYFEDVELFMPPKCHSEAILNTVSAKWDCTNGDHDVKPVAN